MSERNIRLLVVKEQRIDKLEAENAKLKGLISEALSSMEYYPASLGEYWLVQNSDIAAMQAALTTTGEE